MIEPTVWDYRDNLDYDIPLNPGDPRLVPLNDARGDFSENRILKALGMNPNSRELRKAPERLYVLFGGHRGCGKSTELRRLVSKLRGPKGYCVVFIDIQQLLVALAPGRPDLDRLSRGTGAVAGAAVIARARCRPQPPGTPRTPQPGCCRSPHPFKYPRLVIPRISSGSNG